MIDLVAERSPLGGLERWLADPAVSDVLVNHGEVWVDDGDGLRRVGEISPTAAWAAIEHILLPIGRRLDRASPSVDARLPDGTRVCAVIPPVAVDGVCVALRRFSDRPLTVHDFAGDDVAALLVHVVQARCNVVVSGATSAGKTSLLAAMTAVVGHDERLVTLEDITEMPVRHAHVVRLETRPATADGVAAVELADLLRTALRLRPDRLVVGEVRGREAEQLVQAMNTGHDGSLATVHANSAVDALDRLATLVSCAAPSWPSHAIAAHLARAVDVVVQVERDAGGRRRVREVVEVRPPAPDAAPRVHVLADREGVRAALTRGRR
jgi:pilus assembly protein CpaF